MINTHMDLVGSKQKLRRRQWQPTPVFLPGKCHGWRSLVACSPWGREESDTLSDFPFTFHFEAILFLSKLQSQDSGCTDGSSLNQSPCAGCCLTVPSPHLPSLLPYFFPFSCKESSTFSPLLTCSFLIVSLWTQMS